MLHLAFELLSSSRAWWDCWFQCFSWDCLRSDPNTRESSYLAKSMGWFFPKWQGNTACKRRICIIRGINDPKCLQVHPPPKNMLWGKSSQFSLCVGLLARVLAAVDEREKTVQCCFVLLRRALKQWDSARCDFFVVWILHFSLTCFLWELHGITPELPCSSVAWNYISSGRRKLVLDMRRTLQAIPWSRNVPIVIILQNTYLVIPHSPNTFLEGCRYWAYNAPRQNYNTSCIPPIMYACQHFTLSTAHTPQTGAAQLKYICMSPCVSTISTVCNMSYPVFGGYPLASVPSIQYQCTNLFHQPDTQHRLT